MMSLGIHMLADMSGCDRIVLNDSTRICEIMLEAAKAAGATVLRHHFHQFNPEGVTGVVILAESHIAIHTWPQHAFAAVDIFTCGDTARPGTALESLRLSLCCEVVAIVSVNRGHLAGLASSCTEAHAKTR